MDLTLMEWEEPAKISEWSFFTRGMSLKTNLVQKVTVISSVTANAVYCYRRRV